MTILGIDPGASGGIAFFSMQRGLLSIFDMPTVEVKRGGKNKREVSAAMLNAIIGARDIDAAFVEKVGAMPGQGVSSMFQFGRSVGMIEGVLAALEIPTNYVTPQSWQKAVGARGGKDASRARAAELFPAYAANFTRKKDDGRADAALIAWYGAQL
jgi:crossover junction endodeoxyribonuclease RuvC